MRLKLGKAQQTLGPSDGKSYLLAAIVIKSEFSQSVNKPPQSTVLSSTLPGTGESEPRPMWLQPSVSRHGGREQSELGAWDQGVGRESEHPYRGPGRTRSSAWVHWRTPRLSGHVTGAQKLGEQGFSFRRHALRALGLWEKPSSGCVGWGGGRPQEAVRRAVQPGSPAMPSHTAPLTAGLASGREVCPAT